MRMTLTLAMVLYCGQALAIDLGIPSAPLVKLIKARGYKCAEPALAMQELSSQPTTTFSVYCLQSPTCSSGEDVFRVTYHAGRRVSVARYIDPFSSKVVVSSCR